jgi:uncharacterized cupin superfamily protein
MADEVHEVVEGDGYAVGNIDTMGEDYGFHKIRREVGVTEFGVNAITMPAGYESGRHYHDEQQELYFVHSGKLELRFADGAKHVLGPGGVARVDAATVRSMHNAGDEDTVYVCVGAKGGYIGRDAHMPEGEERVVSAPSGGEPAEAQ